MTDAGVVNVGNTEDQKMADRDKTKDYPMKRQISNNPASNNQQKLKTDPKGKGRGWSAATGFIR
jgi:hypothetical protein